MPNTTVYMVWDIRETSTAVYVANIMCWWPLLRKFFGWSSFIRGSSRRSGGDLNSINAPSSRMTPAAEASDDVKLKDLGRMTTLSWDEEKDGYGRLGT